MLPDIVSYLVKAGISSPSADNAQPVGYQWTGSTLIIQFDASRCSGGIFDASHHAVLLTLGAALENILIAADALGISIHCQYHSLESGNPSVELSIDQTASFEQPSEPHALFERYTNRFPFQRKSIPNDVIEDIQAVQEGEAVCLVSHQKRELKTIASHVKVASEIRFQTQEIHEWFAGTLRFTQQEVAMGNGLDVATFDLPPGGKALIKLISDWNRLKLLNKLGMYKLLSNIEAMPIKQAPAICMIFGDKGVRGGIDAGRLMERVWIKLNMCGIAVQPYYVVPDQIQRLQRGKVGDCFTDKVRIMKQYFDKFAADKALHMVLRIGYPMKMPVTSQRMPLESVVSG